MTELTLAYRSAIAEARSFKEAHKNLVIANRAAFDRFYDLSSQIGEDPAREALPNEAAKVDEIDKSTVELQRRLDALWPAVEVDLFEKIELLAGEKEPELSPVCRLRHDLLTLDEFRQKSVDGIKGCFWDVAASGNIFFAREKSRLGARLVKAWCKARKIDFGELGVATTAIGALPKANYPVLADFEAHFQVYPYDTVADLKAASNWPELDAGAVRALAEAYEHTGSFKTTKGPGF